MRFQCFLTVLLGIAIVTQSANGEPSIESHAGPWRHLGEVAIRGSSFGVKQPAPPLLWDDGMSAPALESHYDHWLPKSSVMGDEYNMAYRPVSFRGVEGPHPRVKFMLGGAHACSSYPGYDGGANVGIGKANRSQKYFIDYYYRVDPAYDEENADGDDNMKELVLTNSAKSFYPDGWGAFGYACWKVWTSPDVNFQSPVALSAMTLNPKSEHVSVPNPSEKRHNNPIRNWVKMQWEGVYNNVLDGPSIALTTYPDGVRTDRDRNGDPLTVYEWFRGHWSGFPKENDLRFIGLGGYARVPRMNDGKNSFRYWSCVYMDNTWARVILADALTYDSATIVEPQIPKTWSEDSISFAVNLGQLPDEGRVYLYVFDVDNNVNASGYPITLGED